MFFKKLIAGEEFGSRTFLEETVLKDHIANNYKQYEKQINDAKREAGEALKQQEELKTEHTMSDSLFPEDGISLKTNEEIGAMTNELMSSQLSIVRIRGYP